MDGTQHLQHLGTASGSGKLQFPALERGSISSAGNLGKSQQLLGLTGCRSCTLTDPSQQCCAGFSPAAPVVWEVPGKKARAWPMLRLFQPCHLPWCLSGSSSGLSAALREELQCASLLGRCSIIKNTGV